MDLTNDIKLSDFPTVRLVETILQYVYVRKIVTKHNGLLSLLLDHAKDAPEAMTLCINHHHDQILYISSEKYIFTMI